MFGAGLPRSRRKRYLYQVASASDGAQTLAFRNADVPEFVSNFSMASSLWAFPKNLAELDFAMMLRFTQCLSYFKAFGNSNETLLSFPPKKTTHKPIEFPAKFSKCLEVFRHWVQHTLQTKPSSATFLE